jgi:curved DNA-binding protein CbpA
MRAARARALAFFALFSLAVAAIAAAKDHYQLLGVPRSASTAQIKKAFRRKAVDVHPDKHPGDKRAADKFARLAEAHDTLSDKAKRKEYDAEAYSPRGGGSQRRQPPGYSAGGFGHPGSSSNFNSGGFNFGSFFQGGPGHGSFGQRRQAPKPKRQSSRPSGAKQQQQPKQQQKKPKQPKQPKPKPKPKQQTQPKQQTRQEQTSRSKQQAGQQSAEETQSVYTTQPLSRATHGKQCPPGSPICLLILTPHVSMLAKTNGIMSMLREAMLDPKPMLAYADTNIESVLASAAYMLYTDALQAEARASGKKAKPSLWGRDVCVIAYKPKRQRAAVLTSAAKDAAVLAFARGALSGDVRFVSTGGDLFQHLL